LQSVQNLRELADSLGPKASMNDLLQQVAESRDLDLAEGGAPDQPDRGAISILSMHSAKGLTFDVVFILGLEENMMPDHSQGVPEQRRLLYVAMTRAKKELFMCSSKVRKGPPAGGFNFYAPSSFIGDMHEEHYTVIDN
jgi:DNA helicase-2/ATP-dependent DNA helicase PcrA